MNSNIKKRLKEIDKQIKDAYEANYIVLMNELLDERFYLVHEHSKSPAPKLAINMDKISSGG